jgi:hypothetical protein
MKPNGKKVWFANALRTLKAKSPGPPAIRNKVRNESKSTRRHPQKHQTDTGIMMLMFG